MIIRVPLLLQKAVVVIYPLDITATRAADPNGEPTSGYDDILREPIAYDDVSGERQIARQEGTAYRIPCQVEVARDEDLRQVAIGDDMVTNIMFVLHRKDLNNLGLLDANQDVVIKKGDRIPYLERWGAPVGTKIKTFKSPGLYVHEVRSASWGFGPDGYDLELIYTARRLEGV